MDPNADHVTPGQIVAGKYRVERVLGAGGMGVVLAAQHVQLGQRVAIKFMRVEALADAQASGRFLREARSAVALSSEHAARVLDVGTFENGAPFMVMEYLAGVDLGEMLRRDGPLPVQAAVGFVMQACEAIAEAHAIGIVHRDLKPANLFLTTRRDGSALVKVLDFGISKAAPLAHGEGAANLTASGMVMGSPGYMSPEQVRSAKGVDARSDLWSLGVTLYELLTGVSPFVGETLGDTLVRIASENPPPIRAYRPDVPPGLAAVIEACLERNLEKRVQTVGELASRLLPFGPPEAALSAERIVRMDGRSVREATRNAEGPSGLSRTAEITPAPGPWRALPSTETPWLRSGEPPTIAARRRTPIALGAAVLVVGLAGAAAAWVASSRGVRSNVAPAPEPPRASAAALARPSIEPSPPAVARGEPAVISPNASADAPVLDASAAGAASPSPPPAAAPRASPARSPGARAAAAVPNVSNPQAAPVRASAAAATSGPKSEYDHF